MILFSVFPHLIPKEKERTNEYNSYPPKQKKKKDKIRRITIKIIYCVFI